MFDICENKLPDPVHGFVNPNPMLGGGSTIQIPTTIMSTKQPFFSSTTTSPMDLNLSNDIIQSDMKNEDSPKSKKNNRFLLKFVPQQNA